MHARIWRWLRSKRSAMPSTSGATGFRTGWKVGILAQGRWSWEHHYGSELRCIPSFENQAQPEIDHERTTYSRTSHREPTTCGMLAVYPLYPSILSSVTTLSTTC